MFPFTVNDVPVYDVVVFPQKIRAECFLIRAMHTVHILGIRAVFVGSKQSKNKFRKFLDYENGAVKNENFV